MLTLPKGKVNGNNFEECMKSSKPIAPIPFGSIEQMFRDKGQLKGTAAHQVLETSSKVFLLEHPWRINVCLHNLQTRYWVGYYYSIEILF